MDFLEEQYQKLVICLDHELEEVKKSPAELVLISSFLTFVITWLLYFIYNQSTHRVPFFKRVKAKFFKNLRKIPMVKNKIENETKPVGESFKQELLKPGEELQEFVRLPEEAKSRDELVKITKSYLGVGEFDWTKGTQSGTVYNGNPELTSVMTEVYGMAAWTNPLHPDTFPGIRKMEAEVVRMSCNLFKGGPESCGTMTTGGTESIILACKAYRDWARDVKGIENTEMLVPITAHAAFDKAADMLDMNIRHVPVDPDSQKVDIKAMERMIKTGKTCMLVGSAPQFPHGSIDDIKAIGKLGLKYNIPVHVDACLGGFLIVFMRKAGFEIPPFDFSVPGVTSISADTHKYGYAPKGSSVILYSSPEYRHYQWFTVSDWPGGIYATSTIGGSRAGGIIAACWASLLYHGESTYVDCTKKIIDVTRYIAKEIGQIRGLKIIGDPQVSVVAIGSDEFNIYSLGDLMKTRHWNLNILQFPTCIHLCCTMLHTQEGVADRFVSDVKEFTAMILANPEKHKGGSAAIYGMAQTIPDRGVVDQITWMYLDSVYATKSSGAAVENGH